MVRRFAMLALSLSMLLGLTGAHHLFAQGDTKKDETKKDETKKTEAKAELKKDELKKDEAKKKDEPLPPIPPEVEQKLAAARKAVAEAIVAAQDAGLVKTSINPPPILDILITGRATDEAALTATPKTGVSPEVFGAWFTGYGTISSINPQNDVRIIPPSGGLKTWYDQRASILNREIEAARKAKGPAAKPKEEMKKEEPKKKDEPKKEEAKKKEETKKEEPKKDEAKKDEAKKEEPKKDEAKKGEPKKDEPKKEEPKKDEPKKDEPKKEETK